MEERLKQLEQKLKEQQEELKKLKKKQKGTGFFLFYLLSKADGSLD